MSQKVKKQFFRILPWSVVGLMVITLLVGVSVNLSSSVLAADTISSATYIDADGDGSVDHIKITFDTNITQCDYEGGDWGVNTAGDFNISITGIDTGDPEGTGEGACDGSDAIVYVSVSADASETGSSADPDISYTDQGSLGDLMDSAAITDKNNIVATDAAAPVVINTIDYYSSGSDGTVDSFDVYYSENVTFNGADLTQFAIVNQGLTGFDSDGNPDAVSGSGTSTLTFTTSGTTWLTGVLATTNVEPTLAYTQGVAANRVQDSVLIPNYAANFGATSMYDYAQPVLDASSAGNLEYYNYNSTGPADAVSFYFTEPVDYIYNDADWLVTANALTGLDVTKCLEAGDGYYNGCVAATANGWVELLAAGTTSLTGISGDVLGEPDVTYSGGGIMDTNLNSAPGFGPLPLTDYAQPYPVSAGYVDNNGDGQIDGAGIQFSENVTYTYLGTDWSASTAGEITNFALTGVDLITCPLGVCTNINLVPFTATADADITGAPTGNNPDLDYVLGNAISDTSAATNGATNFNLADIDDLAAPVVTDTYYEDSDSNGTVDRITMDMTVDEGLTCNFAVGDYALTAGDILNDTTPTGCSVSGNEIYIDVNGESNVTGGATDPTIAFTNFANVYDNSTNNNNVNDFGPLSASDGARPFIWAVETDDSDGNGMIDTINISTSEDLNDDFGDITATVGAYTVSSIDTGLAGNDADFRINLTETGTCDITDITGCDTGATPAVSITANSLLQDNSGWPILISALGDAADFASPIFITRATADGNHDGEIDGYFLLCSEALNNTVDDVTVSIGGGYTVKTTDCSNGWCDWGPVGSAELYSLSLNPSGVWDTDQVPTMDITNGGPIFLADNSPAANLLASDGGPVTPLDGAVPIITEAKYQDASGDGKIDQFELFFSETINAAASRLANENLVLGPGSWFAAAAFGSDATDLLTADVDHLVVPLGTAASNISTWDGSGSLNISLIGTGGGAINEFALADRAVPYLSFLDQTIENGSIEAPTIPSDSWFQDYIWPITDGAAPVLLPGYIDYMSTSGNGTVDKIYLLFSETMTCSGLPAIPCTLGQFAINNQSLTGLDDDGTPTSVGVNGVSGEVDLVTTGTTNLTGVTVGGVTGTEPDVIYTAGASYLQDTAGNAVVNFGPTTINDLTSPYLVSFASTTPNSTYGPTAAINVTGAYTEDIQAGGTMDVTLDNGVGITLTAPGAINAVAGTYNVGATASGEDSADLTLASIDVGTENVLDVGGQVRNNSIIPAGNNLGNNNNIVIDTTAPTANFTAATDNVGSVTGALTSGDKTDDPLLALSGTNEAGSSVDVYNGAGLLGAAAVVGGNWSYSAIIADAITYLFNVIETDTVTNISTPTANFTVIGDMTPPTVTTYSPADGAINVAIAANLVLTFNDNVQAGAGAVLIKRGSDNFIVETITIPDVRVTYSGTQVTINPTATLINSTAYYVQIANGAIKDSAGNDYAGIADTTTWNFSTVAAGGGGGGGGGGSSTPSAVSASNVPLTVLPSQSGTLTQGFTDGSQVIVSIPQNSVTNTTTFTVTQGSLTANNTPLATTGAIMIGNQIFNISATSNGTAVTSFNSNLTITITVPSLPDVTTDLGVYYFDSATNQWVLIPGAVFDTVTNKVTFTTNHLTQFAVFKVAGLPSMLPATSTPVATPTPTPTPTPIPAPTPSAPATVGSQLVYDPSNVTSLLASLSLARNTADESKYRPLITADAKEFGITLSSAQLDAIVNFVVYGISNATIKLGSGERRAVIRDYFETVVRPDIVWTDIELISSGQKPVKRNLAKEQSIVNRVLATYKTIVGRGPNFKDAKEDLAWNTMMYRIRFARDLAKEKVGIRKFEEKYGRTPWSALGWSAVRAWGYSLQFKQF